MTTKRPAGNTRLSDNSRIRAIWSCITRITFIVVRQVKLPPIGYMPIVSVVMCKRKKKERIKYKE